MTETTKKYKNRRNLCLTLDILSWMGLCGALIIIGLCTGFCAANPTIATQLLNIFMPLCVTYVIALIITIFIKEKVRTTIWLTNVILSATILGNVCMWITLALYAVDEFILVPLYKYNKSKFMINLEIDKRL